MQAFHNNANDPNALDITQKQNAHLVKDSKTIPVIDLTQSRVKMTCFDKIVEFLYTGNFKFLKKDYEDMAFTAEDSRLDFVREAFQYIINNEDDCLVVGKTGEEILKEMKDKRKKKNYEVRRDHRNDQNRNDQNRNQNQNQAPNNTNSASKFKRNLSKNSHQRQQNYNNHRHQNRPNKKRSNNGSSGVTRQGMSALLTMLGQAMGGK